MISPREYLEAKLAYEMDVVDAAHALAEGSVVLVDTRKRSSWDHGHVAGAAHVPVDSLGDELSSILPPGSDVVVYGWGPGCNGGTRTALHLVERGYRVREMIGGFEYWLRSGLPVETPVGTIRFSADPLVTAGGGSLEGGIPNP